LSLITGKKLSDLLTKWREHTDQYMPSCLEVANRCCIDSDPSRQFSISW